MKVAVPSIARALLLSVALSQIPVVGAVAQGTCPPGMPPGVFCGERNIAHATAGTYAIDGDHTAVLARVSRGRHAHMGSRQRRALDLVDPGEDRVDHLKREGLRQPARGR